MLGPDAVYLAAAPLMAPVEEEPEAEARAEAAEHKTASRADSYSCFRSPSPPLADSMPPDFVLPPLAGRPSLDLTPPLTFLASSPETDADADSVYEDDIVNIYSEWPSQGLPFSTSNTSSTSSLRPKPRQASPRRPQISPIQTPMEEPPPPPPPPKYHYLPIEYFNLRKSDHTNHPESSSKKAMTPAADKKRTISLPQPHQPLPQQRREPRDPDPPRSEGRSLRGLMPGMQPGPRFGLRSVTHAVRVPKLAVAPPHPSPASAPPRDHAPQLPSSRGATDPARPQTRGLSHSPPRTRALGASPERPPTRGVNHSPERRPEHAFVPAPHPARSAPDLVPAPLAPRRAPYGASLAAPTTTTAATASAASMGLKRTATKKVPPPIPGVPAAPASPATTTLTVGLGLGLSGSGGGGGGGGGLAVPRRRQPVCVPSMAEYLSLEQLEHMWSSQDLFAGPVGAPVVPAATAAGGGGGGKPASPLFRISREDPRSPILPLHPAFREGPQVTSPVYPVF